MDKNTTVVFPAPLMSAIGDVGSFFARETAAAQGITPPPATAKPPAPALSAADVGNHQRGAGERRGSGIGARGRLTARRMDID